VTARAHTLRFGVSGHVTKQEHHHAGDLEVDHGTDDTSPAVAKDNDETTVEPNAAATEDAGAEHTLAADIADSETQSIHAWSQEGGDTERLSRRSWKLPIALAALATAAAVTAGVVELWPHQSAHAAPPPPAAAAAPAPLLTDPDARFLALWRQRSSYKTTDPSKLQGVWQNVHTIRGDLSAGRSQESIIRDVLNKHPEVTRSYMEMFVKTVIDAYHPQPAPPGTSEIDGIFVNSLNDPLHMTAPPDAAYAATYAREVCTKLGSGASVIDTYELIQNSTVWNTNTDAQKFVIDATFWYCAEYLDAVRANSQF
jgi:Protein of unknown function (DUF732)